MDSPQQIPALHEAHIHLRAVGKSYPGGPQGVDALRAIDLQVRRGEIFGIIGRSGAGKSSLLRLLNRLETPSSGQVLIDGEDIARLDARQLARWRQRVGMIFQHFNLMASRTVWQNVAVPLRIAGLSRQEMAGRIDEVLRLVGLEGKHDAYPAQLSGGQKQRVGIARALVLEPEILLCDEATSALDPESTQDILGLLRDINARLGLTIVLITHEMAVIREICDRVIVLDAGRVVEEGEVWRVFGLPRHEVTRTLLGTLHHDLPDDLRIRLRPVSGEGEDELLLALHFTGAQGREPDLLAIGQALGVPTRLLHGGIERIQGHAQGRLLIAARIPREAAAILQIRALADRVELLGYLGRECSPGNSAPTLCHAANSTPSL